LPVPRFLSLERQQKPATTKYLRTIQAGGFLFSVSIGLTGQMPQVAVTAFIRFERSAMLPVGRERCRLSLFLCVKHHFLGAWQISLFFHHASSYQTPVSKA
jgi:hypothetical protein